MAFTHLWKRLIRIAQLRPPVNSGRIPQNRSQPAAAEHLNLAPVALVRPLRWGCWDADCNPDLN